MTVQNATKSGGVRSGRRPAFDVLLQVGVCAFLFYVTVARFFLSGDKVLVSDSYNTITLNALAVFSLFEFGDFLWWDPTAIGGWPAYIQLSIGWFNYLSPLAWPGTLLAGLLAKLGVDLMVAVQFQVIFYYFVLNVVLVCLLSRELIVDPVARWLPPLVFTLGQSAIHGTALIFHGMALAPALLLVYGVVFFVKRRSAGSFLLMFFTACIFVSSSNYIVFSSSIFPLAIFLVLAFAFYEPLARRTLIAVARNAVTRGGDTVMRVYTWLLVALMATALATVFVPFDMLNSDIVRAYRGPLVDYQLDRVSAFFRRETNFSILSHDIVAGLLQWAPFGDVYRATIHTEGAWDIGAFDMDYRYIGAVTAPLLFIGLMLRSSDRLFVILFVSYFVATFVIPYTVQLPWFWVLIDASSLFENIRNMSYLMPRDLPAVLAVILAGMSLEALIATVRARVRDDGTRLRVVRIVLIGFGLLAGLLLLIGLAPRFEAVRLSAVHLGLFLGISVALLLGLTLARRSRQLPLLAVSLLIVLGFDLANATSAFFSRSFGPPNVVASRPLPTPGNFGAIETPDQNWYKPYQGILHGVRSGAQFGLRSWLVFNSRPDWRPMLENWNEPTGDMLAYPVFRVATGGAFVEFDAIRNIDTLMPPHRAGVPFYVHDEVLAATERPRELDAEIVVENFEPNPVRVRVSMPEDGVVMMLDNYDSFWTARVDGAPVPVHRANFTFKAISLPAGTHSVEWSYNPYPVKIAWIAFYLVFLALLAAFVFFARQRTLKRSTRKTAERG